MGGEKRAGRKRNALSLLLRHYHDLMQRSCVVYRMRHCGRECDLINSKFARVNDAQSGVKKRIIQSHDCMSLLVAHRPPCVDALIVSANVLEDVLGKPVEGLRGRQVAGTDACIRRIRTLIGDELPGLSFETHTTLSLAACTSRCSLP